MMLLYSRTYYSRGTRRNPVSTVPKNPCVLFPPSYSPIRMLYGHVFSGASAAVLRAIPVLEQAHRNPGRIARKYQGLLCIRFPGRSWASVHACSDGTVGPSTTLAVAQVGDGGVFQYFGHTDVPLTYGRSVGWVGYTKRVGEGEI